MYNKRCSGHFWVCVVAQIFSTNAMSINCMTLAVVAAQLKPLKRERHYGTTQLFHFFGKRILPN